MNEIRVIFVRNKHSFLKYNMQLISIILHISGVINIVDDGNISFFSLFVLFHFYCTRLTDI